MKTIYYLGESIPEDTIKAVIVTITTLGYDSLTVNELDKKLRDMDKEDPVKYDFALFGLGVNEKF